MVDYSVPPCSQYSRAVYVRAEALINFQLARTKTLDLFINSRGSAPWTYTLTPCTSCIRPLLARWVGKRSCEHAVGYFSCGDCDIWPNHCREHSTGVSNRPSYGFNQLRIPYHRILGYVSYSSDGGASFSFVLG